MVEQETGLFWTISQALHEAWASGDTIAVLECLAELDDMRVVTENEALRQRCEDLLAPREKPSAAKQ